MSKTTHHKKQVLFVQSLLDKPKWYNEIITHPNWKQLKAAMKRYETILMTDTPPKLRDHYGELHELKNWRQNYFAFTLNPAPRIIGVVA